MELRVAVCGTSSAGKTTLSRLLAERLNVVWITDDGNPYFDAAPVPEKIGWQRQENFARSRRECQCKEFVSDGCSVDRAAWTQFWGGAVLPMKDLHNQLMDLLYHTVTIYSHLIYLPFGKIPIVDDNRRVISPVTLRHVDDLISAELSRVKLSLAIYPMQSSSIEDRIEEALRFIKGEAE